MHEDRRGGERAAGHEVLDANGYNNNHNNYNNNYNNNNNDSYC